MLCQRWTIEYKNTINNFFPVHAFSAVHFLQDGFVVFSGAFGLEGIWKLNTAGTSLSITMKSTTWKYKVIFLSASKLILEHKQSKKIDPVYLWNDEIIFTG